MFVSSCEEVDFLHSLFCGVLSANGKAGLAFMRLHGNMCQEVRPGQGFRGQMEVTSAARLMFCFICPGALGGVPHVLDFCLWSSAVYGPSVRKQFTSWPLGGERGALACSKHLLLLLFQDVAARGLHLPQVTWIIQVTDTHGPLHPHAHPGNNHSLTQARARTHTLQLHS